MSAHAQQPAADLFEREWAALSFAERRAIGRALSRLRVSHDTNAEFVARRTFGERVADRVAAFGGSWTFILFFFAVLTGWIVLNVALVTGRGHTFDPYPFILLNLVLSMLAAFQAPVILMSQSRQAAKDRLDAAHDYEVNLKAEIEIRTLHDKLDELRQRDWNALLAIQKEQIDLLRELAGVERREEPAAHLSTATAAEISDEGRWPAADQPSACGMRYSSVTIPLGE